MPEHREPSVSPRDYLRQDEGWPYGALQEDAPGVAFFVQMLAKRVKDEIEIDKERRDEIPEESRFTVPRIARVAGVRIQTVYDFLNGKSWGTVNLIYGIERTLEQAVWPRDHISSRWTAMLKRRERS